MQNIEKALKSDSLWSKCLLSHVCSLWYILLPSHLSTHWNKMGVLAQAMDLLEDMRINKALPSDEVGVGGAGRNHTEHAQFVMGGV